MGGAEQSAICLLSLLHILKYGRAQPSKTVSFYYYSSVMLLLYKQLFFVRKQSESDKVITSYKYIFRIGANNLNELYEIS